MVTTKDATGVMMQLDQQGRILRIIRDDLKITGGPTPATTLFELVDKESRDKAHRFLAAAQEGQATFGWELNVNCNNQIVGLSLAAGVTDYGIVVCGSPSRSGLYQLFDEMMIINNEHLNALRTTLKQDFLDAASAQQQQHSILDQFTRLNNDLVNTQRELARRNAELALANEKLESLATTDSLTGLKNHRAFQEELERQFIRAGRYGTALSLLMLDVDQFKQFNDRFGHPAGDEVLKEVAQILAAKTRADAMPARYGGEEFVIVLPAADRRGAIEAAERYRQVIETAPWPFRAITISVGAATLSDQTPDRASLIAAADAALYRAKTGGRNRVCSDQDTLNNN